MSYGRGGAGNIQALEEAKSRISADLEASQHAADSFANPSGVPLSSPLDRVEPQYAHSGRGGAGNYYSPKELSHTGTFNDAHRSHVVGDGTPEPSSKDLEGKPAQESAVRRSGRGGAGNYSFGVSESEERAARKMAEEKELKSQKLKEDVERGVTEQLAMPQKAKLSAAEPLGENPGIPS